jgi:hypothetical protein
MQFARTHARTHALSVFRSPTHPPSPPQLGALATYEANMVRVQDSLLQKDTELAAMRSSISEQQRQGARDRMEVEEVGWYDWVDWLFRSSSHTFGLHGAEK